MGFPQKIHCIGIGGIGLSALAQYLASQGHTVKGSDRAASRVTEMLANKGIQVSVPQEATNIDTSIELVIYSAAVPEDNPERACARELGIPEASYFEALGRATKEKRVIAIAGTHGKTTTTAMIGKILADAGRFPSVIVGSIVTDFGSNFLAGESDIMVVEACEYKRHFLNLSPTVLVITNIELDHTDYYKDLDDLIAGFRWMAQRVPVEGAVVVDRSLLAVQRALEGVQGRIIDYAKEEAPELSLIGEFNRMNARAAKAAARALIPELDEVQMDASLSSFKGTWRRFEYKGKTASGALVYDDYAHHPTAIGKTLAGVREQFPDKKVTIVFHPHLYSRTKDLFDGFVGELSKADRVILAPIYAAREIDTGEVSSDSLADAIQKRGTNAVSLPNFDAIEKELRASASVGNLILTMGAGDIYKVADSLTK